MREPSTIGLAVLEKLKNQRQPSEVGSSVIENLSRKQKSIDGVGGFSQFDTAQSTSQVDMSKFSILSVPKMLGQGIARSYASTGAHVAKNLLKTTDTDTVDPKTYFGTSERAQKIGVAFFGTAEPFNAEKEGDELLSLVGLDKEATSWQKASFAVLLTSADLFLGGAGTGLKKSLLALKNADNVTDAGKVMRSFGFGEGVINDYASIFANAKRSDEIAEAFQRATKLQATTKMMDGAPVKVVDGTIPMTTKGRKFTTATTELRNVVNDLFQANRAMVTPETKGIQNAILRNKTPTVAEYKTAINFLEEGGVNVKKARGVLDEVTETIKVDPGRFVPNYKQTMKDIELPKVKEAEVPSSKVDEGSEVVPEGFKRSTDETIESVTVKGRFQNDGLETYRVGENVSYETEGVFGDPQLGSARIVGINEKGELLVANPGTFTDEPMGPISRSLQHEAEVTVVRIEDVFSKGSFPEEVIPKLDEVADPVRLETHKKAEVPINLNEIKVGDEVTYWGKSADGVYEKKGWVEDIKKNGEVIVESNRVNVEGLPLEGKWDDVVADPAMLKNNLDDFAPDKAILRSDEILDVKKTLDEVADPVRLETYKKAEVPTGKVDEVKGAEVPKKEFVELKDISDLKKGDNIQILKQVDEGFGNWRVEPHPAKVVAISEKTGGVMVKKADGSTKWINERDIRNQGRYHSDEYSVERAVETKPVLDEVADPIRDDLTVVATVVQSRYSDEAVTVKSAAKVKEAEAEVLGEMFEGYSSWMPEFGLNEGVRERVLDLIHSGDVPAFHGTAEMELYTATVDEIARRSGIKAKPQKAVDAEGAIVQNMRENSGTMIHKRTLDTSPPAKNIDPEVPDYGKEITSPEEYKAELAKATRYEKKSSTVRGKKEYTGIFDNVSEKFVIGRDIVGEYVKIEDIGMGMARMRDLYRNSEAVFGEAWPRIKARIFDPLDDAKGAMARLEKTETDELYEKIVTELGIKRKSRLSAYVQEYGEKGQGGGRILTYDFLVNVLGKTDADKVVKADKYFRAKYHRYINELNASRKALFPGQEEKLISKRQDYYRHTRELTDLEGVYKAFEDPGLGNLNAELPRGKIGKKWHSIEQKRTGYNTDFDAVSGMLNYIPQYAYIKHIEPQNHVLMEFADVLRREFPNDEIKKYIEHLDMITDDLNGLANPMDRWADSYGLRKQFEVLNFANKRLKRNAILGNGGTAFSQLFNIPNTVRRANPVNSAIAIKQTILDRFGKHGKHTWRDGNFIPERYSADHYNKFNVGFAEHGVQGAGWLVSVGDEIGTKFSWNAYYAQAVRTLPDVDPVRYADDMTRKAVAGRGVAEVPILQKSKTFQMFAPFQLEVQNTLYELGDSISRRRKDEIAYFMLATWMMNEAKEMITGSETTANPIQAGWDAYKISQNEKTKSEKAVQIVGRLTGEVVQAVPLAPYVSQMFLSEDEKEMWGFTLPSSKDFYGEDADPIKYGAQVPLLPRALWNLRPTNWGKADTWAEGFTDFVTPYGGAQIDKTLKGMKALVQGGVYDKNGNKMMDVKPGGAGAIQNILFGHWNPNVKYEEKIEDELTSLVRKHKELVDSELKHNIESARQDYEELSPEMKEKYNEMKEDVDAQDRERAENDMRPTLVIMETLMEEGKKEEAEAIFNKMEDDEKETLARLKDRVDEKVGFVENVKMFYETIEAYAYAFHTNPIQAWNAVKNNERIKDTIGDVSWNPDTWKNFGKGVVRKERMPFFDEGDLREGSKSVKLELMKEAGVTDSKTVALEHLVPLGIGGNNQRANLKVVPIGMHKYWTPMENYLIEQVKEYVISYEEAQILILRHKGIEGKPLSRKEIEKYVGVPFDEEQYTYK